MNSSNIAEVDGNEAIFYAGAVLVFLGLAISAYRYDPLLHPFICKYANLIKLGSLFDYFCFIFVFILADIESVSLLNDYNTPERNSTDELPRNISMSRSYKKGSTSSQQRLSRGEAMFAFREKVYHEYRTASSSDSRVDTPPHYQASSVKGDNYALAHEMRSKTRSGESSQSTTRTFKSPKTTFRSTVIGGSSSPSYHDRYSNFEDDIDSDDDEDYSTSNRNNIHSLSRAVDDNLTYTSFSRSSRLSNV
jgi:hypothetical protein